MRIFYSALTIGLALGAGVALAEGAKDPLVRARQGVMENIGGAMKAMGDMAAGKTAFDATRAAEAKAALLAAAHDIPAKFQMHATDPASEARPEIWTNWDDFVARSKALSTAAEGIDTASLDTLKSGIGAVGGACKACHQTYRAK